MLFALVTMLCQSCPGGWCVPPTPPPVARQATEWREVNGQWALILGGVQHGVYIPGDGYYRRLAPGQWDAKPSEPPAPLPGGLGNDVRGQLVGDTAPVPAKNFGLGDPKEIKPPGGANVLTSDKDGMPITSADASRLNRGELATQATKRRLTLIGDEAACKAAYSLLAMREVQDLVKDYIVSDYRPTDWQISHERYGFPKVAKFLALAQERDGTTLFQTTDPREIAINLQAVRKPDPNFDPARVPNHAGGPQGNLGFVLVVAVIVVFLVWLSHRKEQQ